MRVIGAGKVAANDRFDQLDIIEWTEESEAAELQAMDIGLMPLPDEPWARGKCGYKLIQYMACGLPVVASPVGVNCEIVAHGENGFLADTPDAWCDALTRLVLDPALRRRMGAVGRKRAVADYSLRSQAPRLVELFRFLAKA